MTSREIGNKIAGEYLLSLNREGMASAIAEAIDAAVAEALKARTVPLAPLSEEDLRKIETFVEVLELPRDKANALLCHIRYLQGPVNDWFLDHDPEGLIRRLARCEGLEEGAKVVVGDGCVRGDTYASLARAIRARICALLGHDFQQPECSCTRCGAEHPILGG